ncbi:MAG TPA: triose-phosphate isomerase [Candidatus Sumerlaeota bacterium]|nr:triose-phosphate isomerase [Candidatus Sumerlaeota bacterium]
MRRPIVAGNWKMNKTPSQARALLEELKPLVADAPCDVVVAPPFVCLERAAQTLAGSAIGLAAQNVHWEPSGAFTGEVSIEMLQDLGVRFVIIGHSERRQYFGETDETVNRRAKAVLAAGLTPIICVGEQLQERESGQTGAVVSRQVRGALAELSAAQVAGSIIAYEPVWAIGTGKVASTEQAQEVHALIRKLLGELYGAATADQVRIQYGGSMKPDNAAGLLAQPDIDGGLIGGASLKAADFAAICNAAR